ncbi:hypothetical protein [Brytella acorum]|uniref:Uncharacterized protein n=1 Tax=Brytella acorum TaxID=2959299 RepID=A0AA35Y4D1_9PROT|nr:hypothetical protein [Brytella acorum]MDF3624343.1 hypothetical protein [Brytella acorum]CAI9121694.1 hypothetical protein LMG32879_002546 [Brytella acorum]
MRKETLLVVVFLTIVVGTSALIFFFALPHVRPPLHFENVASASVSVGPMRSQRALSPTELSSLNDWLKHHESGWGPMHAAPPSTGDAVLNIVPEKGAPFSITLWNGLSGGDWNNTAVIQFSQDEPLRKQSFSDRNYAPLRLLIEHEAYQRSAAP